MKIPTLALVVLVAAGRALAQQPIPFGPGGAGVQPGVAGGAAFSLRPGGTFMLAAYCGNLLADSPTSSVALWADPMGANVSVNGTTMPLLEAQKARLVAVRGHGPLDPAQPAGQGWLDLYVENQTDAPMDLEVAPGAVFTPDGQARPVIDPGVTRLLAAEEQTGTVGTPEACMAMWAATGSSFQDVSEQSYQFVSQVSANTAQGLLDAAGIHRHFDSGDTDYQNLFASGVQALGKSAHSIRLSVRLADSSQAVGELTWNDNGGGLMRVQPAGADTGRRLYYAAHLEELPGGRLRVTLAQPKTGLAIPGLEPFIFSLPRA